MIDRREFLRAGATVAAGTVLPGALSAAAQDPSQPSVPEFRTITYNVLACLGHPKRAENEVYRRRARKRMAERFAMELELYEPDVVTFQESPSKAMVARIARSLDMKYAYFPGGFPGAVITKHREAGKYGLLHRRFKCVSYAPGSLDHSRFEQSNATTRFLLWFSIHSRANRRALATWAGVIFSATISRTSTAEFRPLLVRERAAARLSHM